MARRRIQPWFQKIGTEAAARRIRAGTLSEDGRAEYLDRERGKQVDYLRNTVKELRKYFKGFKASDGYTLRDIPSWPASRVAAVREYGSELHQLTATPFVRVKPRTPVARKVLRVRTGQVTPRQIAYVYHVPAEQVDKVSVHVVDGQIEERQKVTGAVLRDRLYLFREMVGHQPVSIGAMKAQLKKMLPHMPEGFYQLWTEPNGVIGEPIEKKFLLTRLTTYEQRYDPGGDMPHRGFGEVILGFRWQHDTIEGAGEMRAQQQEQRLVRSRLKEQQRRERRKLKGYYGRRFRKART